MATQRVKILIGSVTAVILIAISATYSQAATYDLLGGQSLGIISDPNGNVNDPAPDILICNPLDDTCNVKKQGNNPFEFHGTYTGDEFIESQNLWKSDQQDPGTVFSITVDNTNKAGTWQQIWQGGLGELLTHYVAVKASGDYHLIGYDLSLITATLVAGDIITGSWSVGGIPHDMSHVSLYNSLPPPLEAPPEIPLPATLPLLLSALGFVGFLGRRRKKIATA